jgi:hypothetical protein
VSERELPTGDRVAWGIARIAGHRAARCKCSARPGRRTWPTLRHRDSLALPSDRHRGRITRTLTLRELLRFQHSFTQGDGLAQDPAEAGARHVESLGNHNVMELDVQVARSDWYEQAVEKLAIGSYLITPVYLPTARRPGRPRSGT